MSFNLYRIVNRPLSGSERTVTAKKNIIGSLLIKGWSVIIQLMLVPLTIDYLSPELYGIWLTISSIILWMNFFDVGFNLGLKNRLAEALAKNDLVKGKELISTTYGMMILIFVPLGLILELIVPIIDWSSFLNISQDFNIQLINVVRVLIVSFCLQMIFNTIVAILSAYQKTALSSIFPVIGNLLSLIVIWFLTKYAPSSILNLALSISFLPVIVLIISTIILFKSQLKEVFPSINYFRKSQIPILFHLGIKFFIIQIQLIVLYNATNILISNVSSPESVTTYNIAHKYLSTGAMFFTIMLNPLWPAFTDAYVKKDFSWMRNAYLKMIKVYVVLIISIILLILIAPIVYRLWIQNENLVPWVMTLSVGIFIIFHSWNSMITVLINGIGDINLQTYVTAIGMIIHIPLSLFLGEYFGGVGVIWSMSLINFIYCLIFTSQLHHLIKFRFWHR